MGAQYYEEEIARRAGPALQALRPDWQVDRVIVRSVRSHLPGTHRLPIERVASSPMFLRRAIGNVLYPRGSIVHRMSLELPPGPGVNVVTLHDVVSWMFDDESRPVPAAAEELRKADAVICVSHFSASEAQELLGLTNTTVVHNGVDQTFFDPTPLTSAQLAGLGITGPFVLAAGGASKRKNLEALAAAWPNVHRERQDVSLVLSGPEHPRRTALFGDLPGVHLVGRIEAWFMPGLFAAARAVVVPSVYEGFGLPALEAMAARVPVVASRTSSLPEVVGDGGLLVEPDDRGIADGLLHVLTDSSDVAAMVLRGRVRAAQFTWERSIAGHAAVWTSFA